VAAIIIAAREYNDYHYRLCATMARDIDHGTDISSGWYLITKSGEKTIATRAG